MRLIVDVGGTNINVGKFNKTGAIIENNKYDTLTNRGQKEFLNSLKDIIKTHITDVNSIGICVGGIVKANTFVEFCPNIPLKNFNLKSFLEKEFNVKVYVDNDVNFQFYGEFKNLLNNENSAVGIFIGTGVGGALVLNEKLYSSNYSVGEIGHMKVKLEGKKCGCNQRGCLEAYIGKTAIIKEILKYNKKSLLKRYLDTDSYKIKSKHILKAYLLKDKLAIKLIERMKKYLALAIASINNLLKPEVFIVGGGLIDKMWEHIEEDVNNYVKTNTIYTDKVKIKLGKLRDESALIGGFEILRSLSE